MAVQRHSWMTKHWIKGQWPRNRGVLPSASQSASRRLQVVPMARGENH
jgi:hypothetical protein